jgi:TRAP-type C4-dicarboxylate transport system permease small subunit
MPPPGPAWADAYYRLAHLFAVISIVLLMTIGAADVIGTYLLRSGIPSVRELSEVLLALLIFSGIVMACREDRHISVDLFTRGVSGTPARMLHVFRLLVAAAVFGLLAWRAWASSYDAFLLDEHAAALIRFPIWPFKFVIAAMLSLAALECLRLASIAAFGRQISKPASASSNLEPL